jgi:hypothetical protein
VNVATGETKAVVLHAEALPGELQIEPTPSDARVLVDGRDVARGTWSGTLPSGVHGVEVGADWHATLAQSVVVSSRHPQSLRPILEPVPRAYVEFVAGFTLFAKTGVQGAASTCSSGCYGGVFGVRAGYKVTRRASLELAIADFQLPHDGVRTLSGTGSDGTPVVSTDYAESADAQLFFGGAAASYRFLEDTPITVRFLAGGARGFLNTSATGTVPYTFPGSGGETLASYGHPAFSRSFWTPAFGPEVRIGYRFASGIAVDAGLSLLFFFFPSTPSFTGQEPVIVTPPGPSFSGGLVYVVPLTVAVHFDL